MSNKIQDLIIVFLLGIIVAIRIPILLQELPPFQFCDESIFFGEVVRLYNGKEWVTHEFRAGGFNIYPILILSKILGNFNQPSSIDILLIGRYVYLVLFACVAGYGFYKLGEDISGKTVGVITLLLYAISPYVYSISRYWYPDHYITAAIVWLLHFAIKYNRSDNNNTKALILCGILLGVSISIKYTSLFMALPIGYLIINKMFKLLPSESMAKIGICFIKYFVLPFAITLLLLNFSILFDFDGFLNGFKFNINNYGPRDFTRIDGVVFYLVTIFVLPLGFLGSLLFVLGIIKSQPKFSVISISSGLAIISFLLVMGTVNIVINRNSAIILPFVLPLMAVGLTWLLFNQSYKNTTIKYAAKLTVFFVIFGNFYALISSVKQDFDQDSRILARNWIVDHISKNSTIGTNEFCSGESPAPSGSYFILNDPGFEKQLDYYVINSYWPSRVDGFFKSKGLVQQYSQKYIHFYNFNDRSIYKAQISNAYTYPHVDGYRLLQSFNTNGPNVLIYKKE